MAKTPVSRNTPPDYLLLGQIMRPHGVRGELRMRIMTDYPERIAKLKVVHLAKSVEGKGLKTFPVRAMRMHQGHGLLLLDGVTDRDLAERLRQLYVLVRLEDAVPLEDDEFYLYELIGLSVQTEAGYELGTIKNVLETGANDVYVIDSPQYGEVLFPAIDDTIIDHDIDAGVVLVNIPDGLLPDDPA